MAESPGRAGAYWEATAPETDFPALSTDLTVDVAIVGGGIVGVTAARLLKAQGLSVALIEARRVGRQVTGRSTAKVTSQHNIIYRRLIDSFGEDAARTYAEANQQAIGRILALSEAHGIDCDFERRPAYVYARSEDYLESIQQEAEAAARLGLPASFERNPGLPYLVAGAVRFDEQAQFHPCKYLAGLARTIPGDGSHVFENTRALSAARTRVETDRGAVTAKEVLVATHLPLGKIGLLFGRAFPFAHPMLAARLDGAKVPEGMFISLDQPTHSFRTHGQGENARLVAVGGTYKPGHPDDERQSFADLERYVREDLGVGAIEHRWTNEDYQPEDGLPFIGRSSSREDAVLVATGFNAWGIAGGTVAGVILSDLAAGRANPWASLFDPTRVNVAAGGPTLLKENLVTAKHLVEGWASRRPKALEAVAPGEASVIRLGGRQVGVYRDPNGNVHAVSAVCTHMGCILGWNATDLTWDCPCHGSRFSVEGEVVHGPAVGPLKRESVAED